MAFFVTKDNGAPRLPCDRCAGRHWWKTSKASPFWRCATCQPPEKARENRRPLAGLVRATVKGP